MHLVSKVVFDYNIVNGDFAGGKNLSSLEDLKNAIKKNTTYEKPFLVRINRIVKIMDTDSPILHDGNPFCVMTKDKFKTVQFDDEHFDFIVMNKLMYQQDVRKMLIKKYGSTLNLENKKLIDNIPVLFFGVVETGHYGLKDKDGNQTTQTIRYVNCRHLTPKDIVLNKDFHQIWPIKSKKPLLALEKFLRKTKETIRQK